MWRLKLWRNIGPLTSFHGWRSLGCLGAFRRRSDAEQAARDYMEDYRACSEWDDHAIYLYSPDGACVAVFPG